MTQLAATGPDRSAPWFDELFRAHAPAVYRFVARRAGRDEADDLTAETFTVAWRRRDDVPAGHELPWLYRTAGFVVANHHRKARPAPMAALPDDADPTSVEDVVVADLEVRAAFATLAPRDREILLLAAWEGLHGTALAEVLGISRGGADAALSRARARLREAWAATGGGRSPDVSPVVSPGARSTGPTTQTG